VTSPVRERLLEEHRRTGELIGSLRAEIADIIDSARLVATDDEHDPEGSTIAFERSRVDALLQGAAAHLAEIAAALDRVGDGRYGSCERCGEVIAPERLAARPASTTCLHCAANPRPS
jgi:RNA polymerase-binding transcription factor DksA